MNPVSFDRTAAPASPGGGPAAELAAAYADRHAGQAANLAAATAVHRDDRARVEAAVAELARAGAPFTADTVHDRLSGGDPYDRNVVSSVLGQWAFAGQIVEDTTRRPVPSRHRARRASRNRWWVGCAASPVSGALGGGETDRDGAR